VHFSVEKRRTRGSIGIIFVTDSRESRTLEAQAGRHCKKQIPQVPTGSGLLVLMSILIEGDPDAIRARML